MVAYSVSATLTKLSDTVTVKYALGSALRSAITARIFVRFVAFLNRNEPQTVPLKCDGGKQQTTNYKYCYVSYA